MVLLLESRERSGSVGMNHMCCSRSVMQMPEGYGAEPLLHLINSSIERETWIKEEKLKDVMIILAQLLRNNGGGKKKSPD